MTKDFHRRFFIGAGLLFSTALPTFSAQAAGFYIQEQSVSGLGSAFSGSTTNMKDASTVYFNPAGMTQLSGTRLQTAFHIISPNAQLTNTGSTAPVTGIAINGGPGDNPYDPTPVPNGYFTHQVDDNVWIGLSVTAPFGLANEYDQRWFGRYDSIKTELEVLDMQPTVAYKVSDRLSLGAGLNIQHARAELTNAVFAGVTEGVSTLEGDDIAAGFSLGAQYKPWQKTTLGASYHSGIAHKLEGTASVTGTTIANFGVNGEANLDLPDIAQIGISHDLNDRLTLQGQATWFKWSNFKDIRTVTNDPIAIAALGIYRSPGQTLSNVVQGYEDTWAFAAGAEYKLDPDWTLRTGMQFDQTPTTDQYRTSRTPDGDRTWLSGGATYNISERVSVDFAGTYIWIADGTIDLDRNNAFSTAVQTDVKAKTEGDVGIISMGLNFKF